MRKEVEKMRKTKRIAIILAIAAFAQILSAQERERRGVFLLSPRVEVPMGITAGAIGAGLEAGMIFDDGIYLTGELGGGRYYYGGWVNFGFYFDHGDYVRNVFGISAGYQDVILKVYLTSRGNSLDTVRHHHRSFGGLFWKIFLGQERRADITSKLLFGTQPDYKYRENADAWYNRLDDNKLNMSNLNVTYSLSMGFSIPRIRKSPVVSHEILYEIPSMVSRREMSDSFTVFFTLDGKFAEIEPEGEVRVERGGSQTFVLTPKLGYMLDSLSVNGINVGTPLEYTVRNISRDIEIQAYFSRAQHVEIKAEATVKDGINFRLGTANLTDDSRATLEGIYFTMRENPEMNIEIAGHTDITGSEEFNLSLSKARAHAVRDYLVNRGIAQERLSPVGYGSARPIADNETAEGRAKNRRVEIRSLKTETETENAEGN